MITADVKAVNRMFELRNTDLQSFILVIFYIPAHPHYFCIELEDVDPKIKL